VTRRVRGIHALVHDAVDLTLELVEEGHESSARGVMRILTAIAPIAGPARVVDELRRLATSGVLGSVRLGNRAVKAILAAGLDVALPPAADEDAPIPQRSDVTGSAAWWADATVAALNGAVGDYIHRQGNGLDMGMWLRHADRYLAPDAIDIEPGEGELPSRLVVFVHGLGTSEWGWCWNAAEYHGDPAANFGTLLARDLGCLPLYLRYNSGRHVSENGRLLAERLAGLATNYPRPLDEIILCGHSMGGLVVRSACHYGAQNDHAWVGYVRRVFCLGSPHRGAPLEQSANRLADLLGRIDHPGTRIPATLIRGRSAGIKDLRHGALVDEDWLGRDSDAVDGAAPAAVPLLPDVAYHFISATVTRDPDHPVGKLVGDILVRVPSASGPRLREGAFDIETRCYGGVIHHELQNHPDIYAQLLRACRQPPG
jgi:pimeloyl-ACP methyl ester carboxylesterase